MSKVDRVVAGCQERIDEMVKAKDWAALERMLEALKRVQMLCEIVEN